MPPVRFFIPPCVLLLFKWDAQLLELCVIFKGASLSRSGHVTQSVSYALVKFQDYKVLES